MQGESGKSVNKESSWASPALEWGTGTADEQGVYPWKLDVVDKDVILADEAAMENGSVREADVSLSNYAFQEDEMMSWLRYPLDDSFEKNYCSDFFGDLPNPNVQLLRDSFPYQSGKEHGNASGTAGSTIRSNISHAAGLLGSSSKEEHGLVSTVSSADAAMALGAGRAAGLIPPASAEAEAFNKVRTSMQPSICKSARLSKRKTPGSPPNQILAPSERPFATNPPSSQNLKAADISQACKSPSQLAKPGSTKNAHRSSHPAAPTKPKSHAVGVRQQYGNLGLREGFSTHGDSSADGSITTALSGIGSCKEADLKSLAHKSNQCTVARRWQLPTSPLSRQEADLITCKKLEQDDCFHSSNSASVVTATDKASETLGMPELTITSTSMGSGSSLDRSGKETASSSKRKMMSQGDDSEYQSEDAGDIAPNSKMPVEGRPCTTKRNRAAEIHNLSERRRRDRINEKMKALQRLIPNANKTDKASMLDEAIEYLKLLQSQIQLMSMRTGVGIPQMMIPTGLQHLQMQQMPPLPHVGVGMGMGVGLAMGMGIGMMDPGVPTPGHPIVPLHLLPGRMPPGPSNYATGFQPSTSSLKAHEAHKNQERAGMVESHNTYLAHQQLQPMQMDVNMHTEMNMYNALMEQQQPQQRQRHQSQQAEGNCISKRVW